MRIFFLVFDCHWQARAMCTPFRLIGHENVSIEFLFGLACLNMITRASNCKIKQKEFNF